MKKLKTGDVLFVSGKGIVSKGIQFVTRSKVNHVGIIYNKDLIFETHAGQNARLNPLRSTYKGKKVEVYRTNLTEAESRKVIDLIHKYNGTKYSLWDIFTNAFFSWMPSKHRRGAVAKLSSQSWMICSEITSKILYETNPKKFECLKMFEGLRPDGVLKILKRENWKRVWSV